MRAFGSKRKCNIGKRLVEGLAAVLLGLFLMQGASLDVQAATPEPILYLDFEGDVADDSTSGAVVTQYGTSLTSEGIYAPLGNSALKLDGVDDYLTVKAKDGSALLAGEENITISVFAKTEIKGGNWLLYVAPDDRVQDFAAGMEWNLGVFGGDMDYAAQAISLTAYDQNVRDKAIAKGVGTVSRESGNVWQHIVAVFETVIDSEDATDTDTSISIYVDGILMANGINETPVSEILGDANCLQIGKGNYGGGEYFRGCIDEYKIFDHAFTKEQVTELHRSYYDETIGTVATEEMDVKVQLINFNKNLGKDDYVKYGYGFFNDVGPALDGYRITPKDRDKAPIMHPKLKDGYPEEMEIGSMEYLFGGEPGTSYDYKTVYPIMTNGGGLFLKDSDGYIYYDSALNAAYYDPAADGGKGKFTLYDKIIRPAYVKESSHDVVNGNFLPFNSLTADSVSADEARLTTKNIHSYKLKGAATKGEWTTAGEESMADGSYSYGQKEDVATGLIDLWFGMNVEFDFFMPEGGKLNDEPMVFEFHGDDDVFVYIDDYLVLDVGGTHPAQSASIDFSTGIATYQNAYGKTVTKSFDEIYAGGDSDVELTNGTFAPNTKHTLKFFYMERGGNISYCRMRFNLYTLNENSLLVSKRVSIPDDVAADTQTDILNTVKYKYRVVKVDGTDANGNLNIGDSLFSQGTKYEIPGVVDNSGNLEQFEVETGGFFELKGGQTAVFKQFFTNGTQEYVVEEYIPKETADQYGKAEYVFNNAYYDGVELTRIEDGDNIVYRTDKLETSNTQDGTANSTQIVEFNNIVDIDRMCSLQITKQVRAGSDIAADEVFKMKVMLGTEDGSVSIPLPIGTEYLIGKDTHTVQEEGIIELKAGQTALIKSEILSGTKFVVTEENAASYNVEYSGTITSAEENVAEADRVTTITANQTEASGIFGLNTDVAVLVENWNYDFAHEIDIAKECLNNSRTVAFSFSLVEVTKNGNDIILGNELPGGSIVVRDDTETEGKIVIGYDDTDQGDFYYKITEKNNGGYYAYDDSDYLVGIHVNADNTTSIIEVLKYNKETGSWEDWTAEDGSKKLVFVNEKLPEPEKEPEENDDDDDDNDNESVVVPVMEEPQAVSENEILQGTLPQTGQSWWAIPILLFAGILLCIIGIIRYIGGRHE